MIGHRIAWAVLAMCVGFCGVLVVTADAEPPPQYEPPSLSEQCEAMLNEDAEELAAWLAERNDISLDEAREVVVRATVRVCSGDGS